MLEITRWGAWVLQRTKARGPWWAHTREQLTLGLLTPYRVPLHDFVRSAYNIWLERCPGTNQGSG